MSDPTPPTEQILRFPDGIPGFPRAHRFVLLEVTEDGAFQLLQSLDDPAVSMVVGVPWLFFPDYTPVLDPSDRRELELDTVDDAVVFCPVALGSGDEPPSDDVVYLNLLGPFVVNRRTHTGRQVVLTDASQPLRAPVRLSAGTER